MYTDLKAYLMHIQMLEIINIIIYGLIIIVPSVLTKIYTNNLTYTMIVFIICTIIGYLIYATNQLKADNHKLQIDMYMKLKELKKEQKN